MDQHSSTLIKPSLYEGIAGWEMLQDVFIFKVVNFDNDMFIILAQSRVKG